MTLQTIFNALPVVGTLVALATFLILGRRSGKRTGIQDAQEAIKKAIFRQQRIRLEREKLQPLEPIPEPKSVDSPRRVPTPEEVEKLRDRIKELKRRDSETD